MTPSVRAVHRDSEDRFSKDSVAAVTLIAGIGVDGDTHSGVTVQHRSRAAADPTQPNLRQVHLMHMELFDQLHQQGFDVQPGQLGENVTTAGLDLLALPKGTRLHIGATAVIEVTGLRNPCSQIDDFMPGLLKKVAYHGVDGSLVRKSGIMGVVETGGDIGPDDFIKVQLPFGTHEPLERV